jgi:hypothetical protein
MKNIAMLTCIALSCGIFHWLLWVRFLPVKLQIVLSFVIFTAGLVAIAVVTRGPEVKKFGLT